MSHTDLILFFCGGTWVFWTFIVSYFFVAFFVLPFSFKQVGFRARILLNLVNFWALSFFQEFYFYYLNYFFFICQLYNIWFGQLFNFVGLSSSFCNFQVFFLKINLFCLKLVD